MPRMDAMTATVFATTCTRCGHPVHLDDTDWTHTFTQTATCCGDPIEPRTT